MGPTGCCEGGGEIRRVELLGQLGDTVEDGEGAQEQSRAQDAQANADHQVFEHWRDGGDEGFDRLFEALGEPDVDIL